MCSCYISIFKVASTILCGSNYMYEKAQLQNFVHPLLKKKFSLLFPPDCSRATVQWDLHSRIPHDFPVCRHTLWRKKNMTHHNSIVLHLDNSCTIQVKILLCTEFEGERKCKFYKITSMMDADLTAITLQKSQNILWRTQNFLRNHSQ